MREAIVRALARRSSVFSRGPNAGADDAFSSDANTVSAASAASRGFSLLELLAVLAITAITAGASLAAINASTEAARLVAARRITIRALREARRLCYLEQVSVSALVRRGAAFIEIQGGSSAGQRFDLPSKLVLASAPADEDIAFRPGGFADNATLGIGHSVDHPELTVVVNQRGLVR